MHRGTSLGIAVRRKCTDVWERYTASIFRIGKYVRQETGKIQTAGNSTNTGGIYFRNVNGNP
jgi:hypothetical protein